MATAHKTPDVLVRTAGGTWQRPLSQGYVNEDELQRVLDAQPSLIEGVTENAKSVREFLTGVGPADLIIVDVDGTVTVVECKLARNQEIRRTIMGQVLDYASRLAELTPSEFEHQWTLQNGPSLEELFTGSPDGRAALEANLSAGIFTLVLAVDAINDDLRRIVRYLNTHTSAGMRLLAIELRRVTHGQTEILIPTVYGAESAEAKDARTGTATKWTQASVEEWLANHDAGLADAVAEFSRRLTDAGFTAQGGVGQYASMTYGGKVAAGQVYPFSVYCGENPTLSINFQWVERAGEAAQHRFLQGVQDAGADVDGPGVVSAGYRKRPGVPLKLICDEASRSALVTAASRLHAPSD